MILKFCYIRFFFVWDNSYFSGFKSWYTQYIRFFFHVSQYLQKWEKCVLAFLICVSHLLRFKKFRIENNTEYYFCVLFAIWKTSRKPPPKIRSIQKIFFRGGREGSELKVGRGPTLIIRNRDKQTKKPKNHEIPNLRGEDCRRGHNCDNFTL